MTGRVTRPGSVLFACTLNSVRSPMAEAIARHHFGRHIYFDSVGVDPQPLDPMALTVMDEVGLCLRGHTARGFNSLMDTSFDMVVSFSEAAHAEARRVCRTAAVELEYWPMNNPGITEGSREARLCLMRHIRDRLTLRIRERFGAVEERVGA